MAEDLKQTEFSYNEKEAEAVARCETGVGDLPSKAAFWIILMILITISIRIIFELPLPPMSMMGMYGATLLLWILFSVYIRHRIRVTAEDLKKRTLYLVWEEEGFSVYEFSSELRYHTAYEEIASVEKGEQIYRITSPMGRICIPVRTAPAEFRDMIEKRENVQIITRRWM